MVESNREEIAKLEALYANNPGGRVFTHLAEAYRKAGELDRARTILETGITRHSEYASAHVVLGRVLADQGALEAAAVEFRRVLELDPENRVALRSLGDIARNSDPTRALEHYRHLRSLDPADDDLANTIASLESRVERDVAESPPEEEPPAQSTPGTDEPAFGEPVEPEPRQPIAAEANAEGDEPAWGETPSALAEPPAPVIEPPVSEPFDLEIEPKTASFGDDWHDTGAEDEGLPGDLAHLAQFTEPAAEPEAPDSDAMMSASSAFKELGEPSIEPIEAVVEPPTESAESFDEVELPDLLPDTETATEQPVEEEFWEALPATIVEETRAEEPPSEGATSWDFPAEDLVTAESTEEVEVLLDPIEALLIPEALVDPGPSEGEASPAGLPDFVPDFMAEEAPEPLMHEPTFEQMLTANLGPESPLASGQADLPTETLAELYRTQGFFGRAADVYRSLLVRSPHDVRLRQRLREVEDLEHSPMEAAGERMFDELNVATPEDDELSARVAATSEEAGPPEAWLENIEAAWTGGDGAADLADSPYAWPHDATDEERTGTSLQEYLRTLLAWRPTEPFRHPEPEPEPVALTPAPAVAEIAEPAAEVRQTDVRPPDVPQAVTAPVELEPWEMPWEPSTAPEAVPAQPVAPAAMAPAPVPPSPPVPAPTPPPAAAAAPRKASGNVVEDAFEEWFSGGVSSPAAAPTAPVDDWFAASSSPSVAQPPAAAVPTPQPPPAARASEPAAPAPTVEDTAEDESDDDLEVFRSWLQSLKR